MMIVLQGLLKYYYVLYNVLSIKKVELIEEKKTVFREENHIYFRSDVTSNKIDRLCNLIVDYNREQDFIARESHTSIHIAKPLYVHITSNGGDLLEGFKAYDYIRNSEIQIYTVAEGYT